MDSLTNKAGIPQMRCKAIAGGAIPAAFSYEVRVMDRWIPSNYQFARWVLDGGRWLVRQRNSGISLRG